jgi:type IV pilus assembly protein PilF
MRNVSVVLLMVLLSACVTTKTGPFTENISVEKEVESRVQVAITYLQDNRPEDAIAQLQLAYEKSPKSARVNEVLGIALERTGEFDKSEKYFERMLKYDGSYTRGRSNYASFLIGQKRYEDAEEQLQIIVKDIYYRKRAIAYWQLSFVARELGQDDKIEQYLMRAVALDPRFAEAYLELAKITFEQKNYPKSYQYMASYRKNVNQSSAEALLLGIELARVFEDKDEEASFALALKNLYPKSKEYLEYLKNN